MLAKIQALNKSNEPFTITQRGRAAAVLIGVEAYEKSEHEKELLRLLAKGDGEIESGEGYDLDTVLAEADARLTDRLDEARTFVGELRELREEILRVAALPYKPDLNDGVIINAAPLHRLFRLRSWARDTEECWKKLAKGDYDWAHLAYTIWPERVREVCRTDRSVAIAHGLEDLCEVEAPASKGKGGRSRRKKEIS